MEGINNWGGEPENHFTEGHDIRPEHRKGRWDERGGWSKFRKRRKPTQ